MPSSSPRHAIRAQECLSWFEGKHRIYTGRLCQIQRRRNHDRGSEECQHIKERISKKVVDINCCHPFISYGQLPQTKPGFSRIRKFDSFKGQFIILSFKRKKLRIFKKCFRLIQKPGQHQEHPVGLVKKFTEQLLT